MKLARYLPAALLLAGLALVVPRAYALSSQDLLKQGISLLRDGKSKEALDLFSKAQRLDPGGPKPHYYIASALERLGEPDSARAEYETAIKINPKYVEALTGLGKLDRKQGMMAEGTAKLELAVKYDPKDAPALYALGQSYLEDKRYPDAEKVFRKGTLLKQGRALFLSGTGLALEGQGDLKQAEELFIRARETDPNNLRVRLDLGGFYTRKKIPVLAAPEYGRATELDPKNPEVHYLYGKALVGMNEFNAGLTAFIRATQCDSAYAPAYLESGHLFFRAKRYKEAADNFRVYTGLKPEAYEGYSELGRALSKTGDPADRVEATIMLTRANELKPGVPEVLGGLCSLYSLQGEAGRDSALVYCDRYASVAESLSAEENLRIGTLYVAADDSAKAVEHLTRAVAQDSTMSKDANFQLGFMFFVRRDYPSAVPYFQRTVEADSNFVPALQNLALCKLQMGDKSGAIETLRRSLAVKPNDTRPMIWIAQTMLTMEPDSLPVALDFYRSAIEVDSVNTDAYRGAGLAMLLMDNCSESQGYLERAKELEPNHVQGHIWLAQAYSKCKDQTRAKMEFNEALQIDPENREASRGLDIIRKWEQQQLQRAQGAAGATGGGGTTP
ncbi:MAG: tetratricopeptide repeat protein [Candidatus Eiseniibacteriota bacterium]